MRGDKGVDRNLELQLAKNDNELWFYFAPLDFIVPDICGWKFSSQQCRLDFSLFQKIFIISSSNIRAERSGQTSVQSFTLRLWNRRCTHTDTHPLALFEAVRGLKVVCQQRGAVGAEPLWRLQSLKLRGGSTVMLGTLVSLMSKIRDMKSKRDVSSKKAQRKFCQTCSSIVF